MSYAFERLPALNEVMQMAAVSPIPCTMERWTELVAAVNEEVYSLFSDRAQYREEADKASRKLVEQETMHLDEMARLRGVLEIVRKEIISHVEGRDDIVEAVYAALGCDE